jgi:chromosome segregation ATPase
MMDSDGVSASDFLKHDAALRARVAALERDVNQLNTVLRQAEQEITRLEGEARGNHARIEQLDAQLAAMTTERNVANAEYYRYAEYYQQCEQQLATAQDKIDRQNQQLAKEAGE